MNGARNVFWLALAGALCALTVATAQIPGAPFNVGGGVAAGLSCLLTGGADCTMTGTVVLNTAAGTNAALSETGVDRASGSAETFLVTNSGAGENTLTPDALNVVGSTTFGGTATHNGVATDVACGAGETWTNSCTNATFSTGKVTVPTLATTTSTFQYGVGYAGGIQTFNTSATFFGSSALLWHSRVTSQAIVIAQAEMNVASNTGTGSVVVTITDGTNTCTATFACGSGPGVKSATVANGAGNGCSYAAGVSLTGSITTGCSVSGLTGYSFGVRVTYN